MFLNEFALGFVQDVGDEEVFTEVRPASSAAGSLDLAQGHGDDVMSVRSHRENDEGKGRGFI